ncbi:fungal specific transcription factor [Colletotrichum higginsianum]|nr:fungal specific transcription factor [Colletotrichum higginsianum]
MDSIADLKDHFDREERLKLAESPTQADFMVMVVRILMRDPSVDAPGSCTDVAQQLQKPRLSPLFRQNPR